MRLQLSGPKKIGHASQSAKEECSGEPNEDDGRNYGRDRGKEKRVLASVDNPWLCDSPAQVGLRYFIVFLVVADDRFGSNSDLSTRRAECPLSGR